MTNSEKEQKEPALVEPARLVIRLARKDNKEEVEAIDALRKKSYLSARHATLQRPPEYFSMANDSPGEEVLVAFLHGELVASVRLGLARTQDELFHQLGAEVLVTDNELPILTAGRACAVPHGGYYKALRLAFLQVAELMTVEGRPVASQMGVNARDNKVPEAVLRYGYEVFPVDRGDFIFDGPHVANRLRKERFLLTIFEMQAAQLKGSVPLFDWEGPLPFKDHLPSYLKQ